MTPESTLLTMLRRDSFDMRRQSVTEKGPKKKGKELALEWRACDDNH